MSDTITTPGEHPRGRDAIEGLASRIMASPAPGVTREDARAFAVGIAKRHDAREEMVHVRGGRSIALTEARGIVRRAVCDAIRRQPRYAAGIARLATVIREEQPLLSVAAAREAADAALMGRLVETTPFVLLRAQLLEDLVDAGATRADAPEAMGELIHPEQLGRALDAACAEPSRALNPAPECETIVIPVLPSDFD